MDISVLLLQLEALRFRLDVLEKENAELKERLSTYENRKNSRNSSLPPSKDIGGPKKNQSLRKSSGKKSGGQPGHKGSTLEMVASPDNIIELMPSYCNKCGASLAGLAAIKVSSRQVIDIPSIKSICTEYQSYGKECGCGCQNIGDFPSNVNTPVSYGPTMEGLVGYFHARQHLPFARMKETLNDVFNIPISEGGIHCLLKRLAQKADPVYQIIKQQINGSPVVGTDETGVKVNGENHWMWVWQTPNATYISHSPNRGSATIKEEFPKGFSQSVLVSDGWKPQLSTTALHHQSCFPHLLRRLNYLNEKYDNHLWGITFQKLLYQALTLKKDIAFESEKFIEQRNDIIQQLQNLIEQPPDKKHKELYTFYKRICREDQHLFVFLYLENVPADNNASERAIRNIKVKQKISGQFKTQIAAKNFAKIRSVIDTTVKNGMNVLNALIMIAKFEYQL